MSSLDAARTYVALGVGTRQDRSSLLDEISALAVEIRLEGAGVDRCEDSDHACLTQRAGQQTYHTPAAAHALPVDHSPVSL